MNRCFRKKRIGMVQAFLLLTSLLLIVLQALPVAKGMTLEGGGDACLHRNGAAIECFLNATAQFTFEPNTLSVPSGASVLFVVGSLGSIPHNFTLDSMTNDTNLTPSMTPDQLFGYFNFHSPLIHIVSLNVSGPAYVTRSVELPAHGVLEYLCEVPGHFQSGMYGHLYVGMGSAATTSSFQLTIIQLAFLGVTSLAIVIVAALFLTRERQKRL